MRDSEGVASQYRGDSDDERLRRIEAVLMERWLRHDEARMGLAEPNDGGPNNE